mgnify:CR=1 FL=1
MSIAMSLVSKQRDELRQPGPEFWYRILLSIEGLTRDVKARHRTTRKLFEHLSTIKEELVDQRYDTQRVPFYISHGQHRDLHATSNDVNMSIRYARNLSMNSLK